MRLPRPFGLPHQPARTEQRIADHHRDASEDRERAQPVETAAGISVILDMHALQDRAARNALRQRGGGRTEREGDTPVATVQRVAPAEHYSDAAEHTTNHTPHHPTRGTRKNTE